VAFEAGEIIRWFKQKHVTLIHTVPSLAQLWIAAAKRLAVEKNYIKELRWVFFAGEPLNKTNVD
jgi:acyl-coenzyme A synthetase/AMP-(fatty) acid ligase